MGVRESIAYNRDLIRDETIKVKKNKTDTPLARGVATIELFDSVSGEKVYEAKTENVINSAVSKLAYMDFFYEKIKGSTSEYYYDAPFNIIALFDSSEPENADNKAIKGKMIGYADKLTTYSGTDKLKGCVNKSESSLDIDGDGLLHFVFDFPTHAANGTFQKIAWLRNSYTFNPRFFNMGQGENKVLDSQIGIAYRGNKVYQLRGTSLRVCDKNNFDVSEDFKLGTDSSQNGIYVTQTHIWTVANSKKIYKYDLNKNLINTYTLTCDIAGGKSVNAQLHYIYIDDSAIYLGSYLGYSEGSVILKMSFDLQTVIASRYYPAGSEDPQLQYKRGGFGKFDDSTLLVMREGHYYSLIDKDTLEFIGRGAPRKSSGGWAFAQNEDGRNISIGYKNDNSKFGMAFWDIEFNAAIGAETLLAAPVTKTPTNTMKIQYDFQIQKIL